MTAEQTLKRELLLAFHILDLAGQKSGIAGHLTARQPGQDAFWCHSHGLGFDEVRAGGLNCADLDLARRTGSGRIGPSLAIHAAIYRARPDVACIVHTHDAAAVALTATGAELLPLYQSALLFADDIATHRDYDGIVETAESGRSLAAALGPRRALLLANHGTLVAGASIREAVHATIMLAEACRIQIQAMARRRDARSTPSTPPRPGTPRASCSRRACSVCGGSITRARRWPRSRSSPPNSPRSAIPDRTRSAPRRR